MTNFKTRYFLDCIKRFLNFFNRKKDTANTPINESTLVIGIGGGGDVNLAQKLAKTNVKRLAGKLKNLSNVILIATLAVDLGQGYCLLLLIF